MAGITLQPLSLGELLDRMFSVYRKNFLLFFGIMLIPCLLAMASGVLTAILSSPGLLPSGAAPAAPNLAFSGAAAVGMIISAIAYWIVYALALGATTFAVADVYLGRTASIRNSYRRTWGRVRRLLWLMFLIALRVFGLIMLLAIGMAMVMPLTIRRSPGAGVAFGLIMLVVLLLIIFLAIWLALRYSVAVPSLVLEDLRARPAIKRSVQLMQGSYGRCFLLLLLTVIVTYVTVIIFQGPLYAALIVSARHGQMPMWLLSLSSVFSALGQALSGPLIIIGLVLLYYDIRVRKEAFDLELMMSQVDTLAAQSGSGAASAAVAPTT